jgi:hypothetical protein
VNEVIGWSDFALERHRKGTGNSFFDISELEVLSKVVDSYLSGLAMPGQGETGLDRKIIVPIDPAGFFISMTPLVDGLPIRAAVTRRQPGEDPYIETFIDTKDAERLGIEYIPAKFCNIVLYSREALLENNGKLSSEDNDWEIVAVLASLKEKESMPPLTMARNFLEKTGGTKSIYSAEEFALAIYENSNRGVKIKDA